MLYQTKHRRVHLLDEIRGADILLMIFYHAMYDLVYLFGVDFPFHSPVMDAIQTLICTVFIFIAGISSRYARNNVKRGLLTLGIGVGISLVTWFFMPDQMIWFGILHFMGAAMLLFALLRPLLDKLPVFAGLAVCMLLFFFTRGIPYGYVGFPGLWTVHLPRQLYSAKYLLPLGFGGAGSDYFPLLPWLFLFLAGSCLGVTFQQNEMPGFFYRRHSSFLSAVGRRTLLIYVLHQPVLYGVLWVVFHFLRK